MKKLNANFRKLSFIVFCICIFTFSMGYSAFAQPKERDYWPTNGWKTSFPELQGLDSDKLSEAVQFINDRLPDVYSFLVVKNGYIVFEDYYKIGRPDHIAVVHSVTKSVMSALIGIALEQKYIQGIDQKLAHFFPSYFTEELDRRKKDITLKHLLTMSAGFEWNDRGTIFWQWYSSPDWLKFTIQLPQINKPGNAFKYNTSLSHVLSILLSKIAKTSTLGFADQNLFSPLGIQSKFWYEDPQGFNIGGFGLSLTARDLAKIGYLYLNNGFWDGRSIIPEAWVKESTEQQIHAFSHPRYGAFGYGYQWWVKKVGGYSSFRAWGRRGQFIVVVPELDLVIVVTSETDPPHPRTIHYSPLFDLVASAVRR